jgi:hypothetical protein
MFLPPPGGFKVQQVQQIHKRPCLQEVSEFLKVQQKCNTKCNKVQRRRREGSIQFWAEPEAGAVAGCTLQVAGSHAALARRKKSFRKL